MFTTFHVNRLQHLRENQSSFKQFNEQISIYNRDQFKIIYLVIGLSKFTFIRNMIRVIKIVTLKNKNMFFIFDVYILLPGNHVFHACQMCQREFKLTL